MARLVLGELLLAVSLALPEHLGHQRDGRLGQLLGNELVEQPADLVGPRVFQSHVVPAAVRHRHCLLVGIHRHRDQRDLPARDLARGPGASEVLGRFALSL